MGAGLRKHQAYGRKETNHSEHTSFVKLRGRKIARQRARASRMGRACNTWPASSPAVTSAAYGLLTHRGATSCKPTFS